MEEKEFVKNALKIMEFEEENIDASLVQFVNMWEYKVATKEKPMLLTVGLQSCVALYAWEGNFAFLAHMNIVGGNSVYDFETTDSDIPIKCKKVDRLYEEIIKSKENITNILIIILDFVFCILNLLSKFNLYNNITFILFCQFII